jgi:hypothetical protein
MTQKEKKAVSKSIEPTKVTARPKARTRSIAKVLSENEVQQKAYSLWESRGRPIGSPEVDWYRAKEQLSPEK